MIIQLDSEMILHRPPLWMDDPGCDCIGPGLPTSFLNTLRLPCLKVTKLSKTRGKGKDKTSMLKFPSPTVLQMPVSLFEKTKSSLFLVK